MDAGRLWAGGAASACVAALTAVVGILAARGLLHIPVLAPRGHGAWGGAGTVAYALASAAIALAATAVLHLLLLTAPRARLFFAWIMVLLTAIAAVVPLSLPVDLEPRLATAVLNVAIGLAVTLTLSGVASVAVRSDDRAREFYLDE
ncbi:hypothetical protein EWH70_02150 [Amycolatopsis suaedae]|uniref:Uncharacterized protein n=1 Tax=Amycolatopsis suaedae TaxID=2510978 RepID=A0A4Q7JFT9_9PSEU|nr:hypothetical protein EWH70_02150 [Amycolatopsis suaedae]